MAASIQIWGVRTIAERDGWQAAVRTVADLGFSHVEPFAVHAMPSEMSAAIAQAPLTVPTVHGFIEPDTLAATLDASQLLGAGTVFHPAFDVSAWQDESTLDATAAVLIAAADAAEARGMRVGFHNHEYELLHEVGGQPAFWALLERLPPRVVVEFDIYWAAIANIDILAALGRLGDRVTALHIKDGPYGRSAEDQVALGAGQLPLDAILAASTARPILSHDRLRGQADAVLETTRTSTRWLAEKGLL